VLYEAAAGMHPMLADGPAGKRSRPRAHPLPDLRTFLPSAPREMAEFFQRALSLRLEERPQTADELHESLARLNVAVAAGAPDVAAMRESHAIPKAQA